MNLGGASQVTADAIRGYARAEVDEFLAAAGAERSRLEAEIADAGERISQARSAIGLHRVMVAMLMEAQHELAELRHDAEQRARAIVAAAEREAAAIKGGATDASLAAPRGSDAGHEPLADTAAVPSGGGPAFSGPGFHGPGRPVDDGSDGYFQYLSRALSDEGPLGPRPE